MKISMNYFIAMYFHLIVIESTLKDMINLFKLCMIFLCSKCIQTNSVSMILFFISLTDFL